MTLPEGCMKQIDTVMHRAFSGHPPLKTKWKGIINYERGEHILYLFHYHHLILKYNVTRRIYLHEWYEKPADKRGLDSAKIWLKAREDKYDRLGKA